MLTQVRRVESCTSVEVEPPSVLLLLSSGMLRPPATWNPKSRHGLVDVIVIIPNRHASRHRRWPFSPACSTTRQRHRLAPRSCRSPRHKQPADFGWKSTTTMVTQTRAASGWRLAASFARAPGTEGRDEALRVLKAARSLDLDFRAEAMSSGYSTCRHSRRSSGTSTR